MCIDYLLSGADISLLAELRLSDGMTAFQARELQHMVDVQAAYGGLTTVRWVATLVALAGVAALAARVGSRPQAATALLGGGLLALGLLVAFGLFMLVSWSGFFVSFHRVFFEEGTWSFYWSDTLIRLFPVRFWQDVAAGVVGLIALGAVLISIVGWLWGRRMPSAAQIEPAPAPEGGL